MSNNKGYNKEEKSFATEPAIKEEAPIEVAPEVAEEVKEDIKEIPEVRQEKTKKEEPKFAALKKQAKVILITRNGCIAEVVGQPGNNVRLFGAEFLAKKLGDIIEF